MVIPESVGQLAYQKHGIDYYVGEKVWVNGTKRVGLYETEIVEIFQGFSLKENKTYLSDTTCFLAIKCKSE